MNKEKFCEIAESIPFFGPLICNLESFDSESNDNILEGTILEEPNNMLKEQIVGTFLEDLGVEPIFLLIGASVFFFMIVIIILIIITLIFGFGIFYYMNSKPKIETKEIIRQYEFPIPPPPPPPPVNFVMTSDVTNN